MREMSSSAWLRQGSSLVFDKESLSPLIGSYSLISLRQALSWMQSWPSQLPGNRDTVLIGGLETILQVLPPLEAEDFLRTCVKSFLMEARDRWDRCGLVFGFGSPERAFVITPTDEEVIFIRGDREQIRLSYALWDGTATLNVTRLIRDDGENSTIIGYHVPRIS